MTAEDKEQVARREIAELKADLTKLRIDVAWIKWIVTVGVGLYLVRFIAEWISMTWIRL